MSLRSLRRPADLHVSRGSGLSSRPISDIICVTYQLSMGVEMMGVMTTQQLLPLTPAGAVLIGDATALVTDDDGGRVFIRGELCFVWDAGDDLGRRLAAVQLVRIKAATAIQVAAAFGVTTVTLRRWCKELDASGAQGLAHDKRGPKGPSRLTPDVVADIRSRRRGGASLRAIATAVGVSTFSVRRALTEPTPEPEQATGTEEPQPQPQPHPQPQDQ